MANALRGEVEIAVEGIPYTLSFGINELCQLQSDLGLADRDEEFMAACAAMKIVRSYSMMRHAVHRALERHHPEMTLESAGDIITRLGFVNTATAMVSCMQWSMPPKSAEKGGEPRPSPGPTSKRTRPARA